MKVFIIAEAGVNHNGDINLAKKLIDAAADSGVDAIKFQTWQTELLVTKQAKQAEYQKENVQKEETQYEMLQRLELCYDEFRELKKYCDEKNIMFLSTPDDCESATFLLELQDIFKIGSSDLTNLPYLRHIGSFRKEVILSTGMGKLNEVREALDILIEAGTRRKDITVLQANTQYPTPFEDVNLKVIQTFRKTFGVRVGYSDHTEGIEVALAAVGMGASVIEKHFTLDKTLPGPDHVASLNIEELNQLVIGIRKIEKAFGSGEKVASPSEIPNIEIVRKSIVAKKIIHKGEIFSEDNITVKRPGNGTSPMEWDNLIGRKAKKDYQKDDLI